MAASCAFITNSTGTSVSSFSLSVGSTYPAGTIFVLGVCAEGPGTSWVGSFSGISNVTWTLVESAQNGGTTIALEVWLGEVTGTTSAGTLTVGCNTMTGSMDLFAVSGCASTNAITVRAAYGNALPAATSVVNISGDLQFGFASVLQPSSTSAPSTYPFGSSTNTHTTSTTVSSTKYFGNAAWSVPGSTANASLQWTWPGAGGWVAFWIDFKTTQQACQYGVGNPINGVSSGAATVAPLQAYSPVKIVALVTAFSSSSGLTVSSMSATNVTWTKLATLPNTQVTRSTTGWLMGEVWIGVVSGGAAGLVTATLSGSPSDSRMFLQTVIGALATSESTNTGNTTTQGNSVAVSGVTIAEAGALEMFFGNLALPSGYAGLSGVTYPFVAAAGGPFNGIAVGGTELGLCNFQVSSGAVGSHTDTWSYGYVTVGGGDQSTAAVIVLTPDVGAGTNGVTYGLSGVATTSGVTAPVASSPVTIALTGVQTTSGIGQPNPTGVQHFISLTGVQTTSGIASVTGLPPANGSSGSATAILGTSWIQTATTLSGTGQTISITINAIPAGGGAIFAYAWHTTGATSGTTGNATITGCTAVNLGTWSTADNAVGGQNLNVQVWYLSCATGTSGTTFTSPAFSDNSPTVNGIGQLFKNVANSTQVTTGETIKTASSAAAVSSFPIASVATVTPGDCEWCLLVLGKRTNAFATTAYPYPTFWNHIVQTNYAGASAADPMLAMCAAINGAAVSSHTDTFSSSSDSCAYIGVVVPIRPNVFPVNLTNGVQSTSAAGTITVSTTTTISVSLSGVQTNEQINGPSPYISNPITFALSGVHTTSAVTAPTASGTVTLSVSLSGVVATSAITAPTAIITTLQTLVGSANIRNSHVINCVRLPYRLSWPFIRQTSTQTITGVSDIQATTQQTQVGSANITTIILTVQTQTGTAAIQNTTVQTQTGVSCVQITTVQTQTGAADIYGTTQRTLVGNADIKNNLTLNCIRLPYRLSWPFIRQTSTQIQTGISRIQLVTVQTLTGESRIQITTAQTQSGTADVRVTTKKTQAGTATIIGVFASSDDVSVRTTEGRALAILYFLSTTDLIAITIAENITYVDPDEGLAISVASSDALYVKFTEAHARAITTTQIQIGAADIGKTEQQTQSGTANIRVTQQQTQTGAADVRNTTLRTQTGAGDVRKTATRTLIGTADVQTTTQRTQSGVSRIQISTQQSQSGESRIQSTTQQTIVGTSRFQITAQRTQAGTADIKNTIQQTQYGVSRIQIRTSQTQTGSADVQKTTAQTLIGRSRIQYTNQYTQSGISNIRNKSVRTQTGTANIQVASYQTQSGVSRIQVTSTQTLAGSSTILGTTQISDNGYVNPGTTSIWTVASITLYPNQTLIVGLVNARDNITSVTWNGILLNEDITIHGGGGSPQSSISSLPSGFSLAAPGGTTGPLVVNYASPVDGIAVVEIVSGLAIYEPLDDASASTGLDGSPGASITLDDTYKFVMGLGAIQANYSTYVNGTPDSPFVQGVYIGTNGLTPYYTATEVYYGGFSTGTFTVGFTGATSAPWSFAVAYYHYIEEAARTIQGTASIQATVLRTITGSATLQITASVLRTQIGHASVRATTKQTQSGVSLIVKLSTQTINGRASIQATTQKTQIGVSRIQVSTQKTQFGTFDIRATTQQTQTGLSRIQITSSKAQFGTADIRNTTQRNIFGHAMIAVVTLQTQIGAADIRKRTRQTIAGESRIQITTPRIQLGTADVRVTTQKTISGVSAMLVVTTQTIAGVSRIQLVTAQTQIGAADIYNTAVHTQVGRATVQTSKLQFQTGVARIRQRVQKTITGVSQVQKTVKKTQVGHARIYGTTTHTMLGESRIQVRIVQTQAGAADVRNTTARTQTGTADIRNTTQRTIVGSSDVRVTTLRVQNGVSRIQITTLRTQLGAADIYKTVQRIQSGVARIQITTQRTQNGIARIQATTQRTQGGQAFIEHRTTQAIVGTARIQITDARIQLGIARIQITTQRTQAGLSRIQVTVDKTQVGHASIRNTTDKTQVGVASIRNTTQRTQVGLSRIQITSSQTQSGVSRIQITTDRIIVGESSIQSTTTKTQAGLARIGQTVDVSIVGTATIVGYVADSDSIDVQISDSSQIKVFVHRSDSIVLSIGDVSIPVETSLASTDDLNVHLVFVRGGVFIAETEFGLVTNLASDSDSINVEIDETAFITFSFSASDSLAVSFDDEVETLFITYHLSAADAINVSILESYGPGQLYKRGLAAPGLVNAVQWL